MFTIVSSSSTVTAVSPLQSPMRGLEVVEFACDGPVAEGSVSALPGVHAAKQHGDGLLLTVEQLHKTLPLLLAHLQQSGCTLTGLATHHATLEDVFVNLTGRQLRD